MNRQITVAQASNTVAGFVEFNYFKQFSMNPSPDFSAAGAPEQAAVVGATPMSDANWEIFKDVQMYRSTKEDIQTGTTNFEGLFALTDPTTGEDPGATSLFNINSLNTIVQKGRSDVNILTDPDSTVDLTKDWPDIGNMLGLYDEAQDSDPEVGAKRAYLLWLWLDQLYSDVVSRENLEGGNYQIGVMGTLGATGLQTGLTTMMLEVPLLTLADQVLVFDGSTACTDMYTVRLGMDAL